MACLPVRGLSYVQVDKHGIIISVDLAHHEVFRAKVSKGGINVEIQRRLSFYSI